MKNPENTGTVILRLNEEESRIIEDLKGLTKQKTATKAIMKAVRGYLYVLSKYQNLQKAFEKINQSSRSGCEEVSQIISKLLT